MLQRRAVRAIYTQTSQTYTAPYFLSGKLFILKQLHEVQTSVHIYIYLNRSASIIVIVIILYSTHYARFLQRMIMTHMVII